MSEHSQNSQLLTLRGKSAMARSAPAAEQHRPPQAPQEPAEEDECLAFGYLRGLRDQAPSIEFRFANNNRQGFPYGWLGPALYNPSAGILLKFVGDLVYLVLIEGSNLNQIMSGAISLYDRGILRRRITWVREMTEHEVARAGEGEATVEHIRTLSYRPDEEPKGVAWLEPFQERA